MNKELYDKRYKIPSEVLKDIEVAKANYPNNDGIKRANFLIKNREITYQGMERLLHDFKNVGEDKIKYLLMGGDKMKQFVDATLASERQFIQNEKTNSTNYKQDTMKGLNITKQDVASDIKNN